MIIVGGTFASGLASTVLGFEVHRRFLFLAVLIGILGGFLASRINCPKCGKPIHRHDVRGYGSAWGDYWFPKRCERCGFDLRRDWGKR
jgi:hypothetical protein